MDQRKLGRFRFSRKALLAHDDYLLGVFAQCIILQAERGYATDCITYIAYSDMFEILEPGSEAPIYEWGISAKETPWAYKVEHFGELPLVPIHKLTTYE